MDLFGELDTKTHVIYNHLLTKACLTSVDELSKLFPAAQGYDLHHSLEKLNGLGLIIKEGDKGGIIHAISYDN